MELRHYILRVCVEKHEKLCQREDKREKLFIIFSIIYLKLC